MVLSPIWSTSVAVKALPCLPCQSITASPNSDRKWINWKHYLTMLPSKLHPCFPYAFTSTYSLIHQFPIIPSSFHLFNLISTVISNSLGLCLKVRDLCALACCSRLWRTLCASHCLWHSFTSQRWPSLLSSHSSPPPNLKVSLQYTHTLLILNIRRSWLFFF